MGAHAKLSPSGWDGWSVCSGKPKAEEGMPDSSSGYADEGTCAHAVLEKVLTERYSVFGDLSITADRYVGERINVAEEGKEARLITVDQEMTDHVQTVADYVERRRAEMGPDTQVLAEVKVDADPQIGGGVRGTADVVLISDVEIEVVDLKYGRGVVVGVGTPEDPLGQLMIYLIGAISGWQAIEIVNGTPVQKVYHLQRYRITVAQPRAYHDAGPIRSLDLAWEDVDRFIDRAKAAVERTEQFPDLRVASEKGCRWCRAKVRNGRSCKAFAEYALAGVGAPTNVEREAFLADAVAFATTDASLMSDEGVVRVLRSADVLRGFLSAVETWAHDQLMAGTAPPALARDYKLVEGRSQRRWMDANDASIAAALTKIRWKDPATDKTTGLKKKEVYEDKLRSPTQIEGLLKREAKGGGVLAAHWDAFKRLVVKPAGKLQLVPASDSRPPAGTKDPATMFDPAAVPEPPPEPTPSSPTTTTTDPFA